MKRFSDEVNEARIEIEYIPAIYIKSITLEGRFAMIEKLHFVGIYSSAIAFDYFRTNLKD